MNAVLKFPSAQELENRKTELVFNLRQKPVLLKFDPEEAKKLLATTQKVRSGIEKLVEFVDSHRDEAFQAGLETIGIELSSERVSFSYVEDTLEDAVRAGEEVELSDQAVALLRRLEKLVSEAGLNISRFSGKPLLGSKVLSSPAPSSNDLSIAAIFFGIVAIGLIIVLISPKD